MDNLVTNFAPNQKLRHYKTVFGSNNDLFRLQLRADFTIEVGRCRLPASNPVLNLPNFGTST
jgi:hypothetical protein